MPDQKQYVQLCTGLCGLALLLAIVGCATDYWQVQDIGRLRIHDGLWTCMDWVFGCADWMSM